jgi:hypothetical protein
VHELTPVLMGAAIALGCLGIRSRILRYVLSGFLVVVAALLAVWINGESSGWLLFIIADVCFVLVGFVGVNLLFGVLSRVATSPGRVARDDAHPVERTFETGSAPHAQRDTNGAVPRG